MRLTRWQPVGNMWNELQRLHDEMNRVFDRWTPNGSRIPGLTGGFPALNVWESEDRLFVEAELPGLKLDDLEIYVSGGNQLTIKGERNPFTPEKGVWHRQERGFGSFSRTLTLPYAVNAENVDARLENGVLTIQLAKHESARPRKITVKAE